MKKITALLMTFILLFSFGSCRKNEPETVSTTAAAITTASETAAVTQTETTNGTTAAESNFSKKSTQITTTQRLSTTATAATSALTTAEPTTSKAATQKQTYTCTISIDCSQILENMGSLKSGKELFVPSDGKILETVTVEFEQGETVFDILQKACKAYTCSDGCQYCRDGGIQLEYEFTPGYNNYYIEGIHQIYEKDCGSKSGWMYKVNGVFPNYGCSSCEVKNGDKIEFVYTLDLGEDVGAEV